LSLHKHNQVYLVYRTATGFARRSLERQPIRVVWGLLAVPSAK